MLGLFFVETTQTMSEADYLKAVWLELKVQEAAVWGSRLQIFGVHAIDYPDPDPTHFYFQAPGRQVFRLPLWKEVCDSIDSAQIGTGWRRMQSGANCSPPAVSLINREKAGNYRFLGGF